MDVYVHWLKESFIPFKTKAVNLTLWKMVLVWAEGDLHNSRRVQVADLPATLSHPDSRKTVREGQHSGIERFMNV